MPPIFELFIINHDKKDIFFMILFLIFELFSLTLINIKYYRCDLKSKGLSYEKITKRNFVQILCASLLVAIPTLVISFYIMISINTFYKEVKNNNITTETLFSSFHITEINETNEFKPTVTYDKSGNKKSETPAVLYEVILNRDEKNKIAGLKDSVTIDVTKVNENGFNVLLLDGQVVTIKEKDAKEIFKTLNKIKVNEREIKYVAKSYKNKSCSKIICI